MSYSLIHPRRLCRNPLRGFTLVEMLIAMAITLLMMAAVARAFAFVGERVRDSRGNVSLSSELRDVTTRLNDELRRCTVSLEPVTGNQSDPNGYFLYYEGPMTDATTTIFGRYNDQIEEGSWVAQDSRFGDLDDYLAFTAIAPPGAWFTGQVPAYILDTALDPADADNKTPVVLRSRYAEIVYFVNPERDGSGNIIDADGDRIADRLNLYRRVLLIRPDLNSVMGTGLRISSGSDLFSGMADAHQVLDISIRRQLNPDGTPLAGGAVIANSLSDLAQPHNRFAHVRLPWGDIVGGTSPDFSMPILALEDLPIGGLLLSDNGSPPTYRPPPQNTGTTSVVPASNDEPVITPMKRSGYLNRNFVLSGDRRGEDVIANNCRALDIQIFDPTAAFYLSSNNLVVGPSDAGYREVLSGPTGADTPTLVPGGGFVDLAYPVLAGGPTRGWKVLTIASSLGATTGPVTPNLEPGGVDHVNFLRMQSAFSGLEFLSSTTEFPETTSTKTYTNSLLKSGRLVISGNQIRLFQPAFDTYTSAYERDGYYQDRRFNAGLFRGTMWSRYDTGDADITDLAADGLDTNFARTTMPTAEQPPGQFGTDDVSEQETSAPFLQTPQAIRVTVRLENVGTRQLRQMSVVHRGSL